MSSRKNKPYHQDINPYLVLAIIAVVLLFYQYNSKKDQFLEMAISAVVTILATYLGVYISLNATLKQEQIKEALKSKKTYNSALKLIYSELNLNLITMKNILEGLNTMPLNISELASCYETVICVSKSLKTDCFYSLISSSAIEEITQNDNVFNDVQQAYYNMDLASDGLMLSQDVFNSFGKLPSIPDDRINQANFLFNSEKDKIKRSVRIVQLLSVFNLIVLLTENLDQ